MGKGNKVREVVPSYPPHPLSSMERGNRKIRFRGLSSMGNRKSAPAGFPVWIGGTEKFGSERLQDGQGGKAKLFYLFPLSGPERGLGG
jgi:hypothetical protein